VNHLLVRATRLQLYFVKFHHQKGMPKVSCWIQKFAAAMILLGVTTTCARADFVFDVTIPPSLTGTLDFTITSNDSSTLSAFGLDLMISPTPSSTSLASFTPDQTDPYTSPGYVFAGQSLGADLGIPFWSPPFQTTTPNDSITGGDSADPTVGSGFVTLSSTASYLATVQFQVPTGSTPGQVFQITLVSNPGLTFFDDMNGNPLNYTASISGGAVNINVNTASAVPEPASSTMLAISSGLCGLLWYRRQRKTSDKVN
jgi:hypothetical protein